MQTSSFLAENIEILGTIVSTIKEEQKLNGDKIYRTDIRCINEKNEAYYIQKRYVVANEGTKEEQVWKLREEIEQ